MGPRLCSRGDIDPTPTDIASGMLQWGRGFVAAETVDARCVAGRGLKASMGPRLCSRGDTGWPASDKECDKELQWGRGFVAAETRGEWGDWFESWAASMGPRLCSRGDSPSAPAQRTRPPLQWGRGFVAAETIVRYAYRQLTNCFNGAAAL